MVWVKNTFDKIYLEAFSFLNKESSREVNEIIKLLNIEKKHLILDACCGWGRHVCNLYERGYKIKGIDISNEFIYYAKKICYPKLFLIKDIRKINYKNKFDIIFNLETSYGYYNDRANFKIIEKIYAALKKEGKFLMELINTDLVLNSFKEDLVIFKENNIQIRDINKLDKSKKLIKTKRQISINGKEFEKIIVLRIYSKKELQKILKDIGFKKIQFFGSLKGEKYTQKSSRLVVLAQK